MSNSGGTWEEVTVAGHSCDVFEPSQLNDHNYALIYLHGVHLNRLVDKPAFVEQFERFGFRVIAPMTGPTWWTDRISDGFDPNITPERHLLDNVLPYLEERWDVKPQRIGLFGTSMGGQGALRFSYKYPDTFPVVAAISPAIDYQTRWDEDETLMQMYSEPEAVRQDTATLRIHPLNWPRHQFFCCCPTDYRWWESSDRLRMKLYSIGIPHECDLETESGGHGFEYYNVMAEKAISFLANGLDRERLRLV